jgi:hypothetical protein
MKSEPWLLYWLQTLVDFLQPYKEATDVVQSDSACIADVHHQFTRLISQANNLVAPHPLADMRTDLKRILLQQWEEHVAKELVITCSLFSYDSAYRAFPAEMGRGLPQALQLVCR